MSLMKYLHHYFTCLLRHISYVIRFYIGVYLYVNCWIQDVGRNMSCIRDISGPGKAFGNMWTDNSW